MKHHQKLSILLYLCAGLHAAAQTPTPAAWELRKNEDGIRVYTRTAGNFRFDDLKVETTLPGKLSSLAALLLDIDNYPNWSFNSEKAHILKRIGPGELYFYSLVHAPWPASDRDLAIHLQIRQDSSTRKVYIEADEIADFIPIKKGIVRVPLSLERWIITPLPDNRISIEYELRVDPGASAPAWLINLFSTKGPYETFCRLREQLRKTEYHDATLPFIRN